MAVMRMEAPRGLRWCLLSLSATAAALFFTGDSADARYHRRIHAHFVPLSRPQVRVHHYARAEVYSPPSASIIVDGNTGEVLQASNPDALRHPASLTKIMTLYLLFERLDAGEIRLDTPLKVSAHAAAQAPTKLGLRAGQTITVEDAIKGVVTRSANDAAVVIAENLAGDEDEFARLMTRKAHALGMSRSSYVNASGLPNDDQITSARDLALLGRAIEDRFPRYFKYFSTPTFVYHGVAMRNHNHLLGTVDGVDGIKTGYTRGSGFNLVTSVHRDGRYLIGVVLGGHSAVERDAHMRELIRTHINEAALRHGAPEITESGEHRHGREPVAFAKAPLSSHTNAPLAATANARARVGSSEPMQPLLVKTISYRIAPVRAASLAPMPALVAVNPPAPPPAVQTQPPAQSLNARHAMIVPATEPASFAAAAEAGSTQVKPASADSTALQAHAHNGWLIQIGAFENEEEAKQHLDEAQLTARAALATSEPFTERVQKGAKTFYRARFAGFDRTTAAAACRELKRNDIDCIALKN